MPGFDGTGPRGIGPMTGGGRGYCSSGLSQEEDGVIPIIVQDSPPPTIYPMPLL
jgi:hypothetical protein